MSESDSDLGFVAHQAHRRLLAQIREEAQADAEVIGLLLMGSVARGDALPGADLDLFLLLADGCSRPFRAEFHEGILVERKFADRERARSRLAEKPMEVYSYLDSRILYDPEGGFQELTETARHRFESYRTPAHEKAYLRHCLVSARTKLRAASAAGDEFKASYVTSMTVWFALEALWAVNDRPLPPGGSLLSHCLRLPHLPPDPHSWLRWFFAGSAAQRVQAMAQILDWLLPQLESRWTAAGWDG